MKIERLFSAARKHSTGNFRERASRDMSNRLSAVFIVVPENDPKTIVGFFTLSSQQTDSDLSCVIKRACGTVSYCLQHAQSVTAAWFYR